MLLGKHHRRIEADDGKEPCHVQNGLNNGFAHFGFEEVQLRRIVPWHVGAIVAVVDVAHITGPAV